MDTERIEGDRVDDVVKRIVAEQLCAQPDAVKPEWKLIEDLGADSLDTVELVMAIEDEYGFMVDDGDENWLTVGDVISYVNRKLIANAAPKQGEPA